MLYRLGRLVQVRHSDRAKGLCSIFYVYYNANLITLLNICNHIYAHYFNLVCGTLDTKQRLSVERGTQGVALLASSLVL